MGGAPKAVALAIALVAVAAPASLGAGRRPAALGVPVPGPTACHVQPPRLLSAGKAPRARLRIDLAHEASTTARSVGIETTRSQTRLRDGSLQATTTTQTLRVRIRTGRPAHGRLPLAVRVSIASGSGAPVQTFDVSGYSDALDGGALTSVSGTRVPTTDRLPREAVGVGAMWRVVNCDLVGTTFARETRTYRLRSFSRGVVGATYRDVLELDPAHVDLGTGEEGGTTVHLKLVQLHGTATGTWRIPLGHALGESRTTVTRMQTVARGTGAGFPTAMIHVSTLDSETDPPAR